MTPLRSIVVSFLFLVVFSSCRSEVDRYEIHKDPIGRPVFLLDKRTGETWAYVDGQWERRERLSPEETQVRKTERLEAEARAEQERKRKAALRNQDPRERKRRETRAKLRELRSRERRDHRLKRQEERYKREAEELKRLQRKYSDSR